MELTDPPYTDQYLLRFLRARKFDMKKTEKMFRDFIAWRIQNNVDNISRFLFSELTAVKKLYPHGYFLTDKIGRPVYIERVGSLKLKELFEITDEERLFKYYVQSYETLLHRIFPACSVAAGKRIDQTCSILDLKGFSVKMMSSKVYHFIQIATKMAQDNYPEILGNMFIVNAPALFSGIWAVVKPWVDKKTRKKVHILGSGFYKELVKFIDPENIPDFLGGKADTSGQISLFTNPGPWNDFGKEPLFPESESEVTELRIRYEESKIDSEDEITKDICEEEVDTKFDLKEMKTMFSRNCNWSFGINKDSLSFKPTVAPSNKGSLV